jgi:hypothetical protein
MDYTKIENRISEYFKMVCPLPYNSFEVKMGLVEYFGVVLINIYISRREYEHYLKKERGRGKKTVREMIKEDMSDMFPYVFVIELKTV